MKNEIVLFTAGNINIKVTVTPEQDTIPIPMHRKQLTV